MSWTLFKANIKANFIIWVIMTLVFCFYVAIIVSMFDPVGIGAIQDMLDTMPKAMIDALGFGELGTTLTTFITGYLYGFLILLFPMVISIVVNHRLIASLVDKGSMAYLLSTPNSRIRIALTQAIFSIASITAFFLIITPFSIAISESLFPGKLETGNLILVNFYALLLYYAIGGIGFFASCIADESKYSLSFGVGVPVAFLVFQMLGNAGESFSWIGNLSLYSLFDPNKIFEGSGFVYLGMFLFTLIAAALYIGGIYIFNKRDLHV